ncbi:MAG TPA: class I SAM-dependent methyltransferase [Syntrophorhabdaceae bacterium]|nr:class I SAM-dependent methyltransferase [Syntrophorhabdaceae bacterium]
MEMNVLEFDRIAREVFAPVYRFIAEKIKVKTGVTEGLCVDLGAGGGYLGIELAKITDLKMYLLDSSLEMVDIARDNIINAGLAKRLRAIHGDVHNMLMPDSSVDLVVSRGSVFFWEDTTKAFREIYRVLAPRGIAYIGGGLGSPEIRKQVVAKLKEMGREFPLAGKKGKKDHQALFRRALKDAGITNCSVIRSEAGLWIVIRKEMME